MTNAIDRFGGYAGTRSDQEIKITPTKQESEKTVPDGPEPVNRRWRVKTIPVAPQDREQTITEQISSLRPLKFTGEIVKAGCCGLISSIPNETKGKLPEDSKAAQLALEAFKGESNVDDLFCHESLQGSPFDSDKKKAWLEK